jgi:hypothetical protein
VSGLVCGSENVETPGRGRIFDPSGVGTAFSGIPSRRFHPSVDGLMTFFPFGEDWSLYIFHAALAGVRV